MLDLQAPRDQVRVALALANLGVGDAVHLVRHRQHGFREELQLADVDGELARLGDEEEALDADEVAVVQ